MPSTLPEGEPVPPDGALPGAALARARCRRGFRRLRARPVLRQPVRLLRLQHLHRYASWAAAGRSSAYADTVLAEVDAGRAGARRRGAAGRHGVLRRWHADPAAPDDLGRMLDGDRQGVRAGRRCRGHHRGEPGVGDPGVAAGAARRPASPGSRSACSRSPRTCWRCWTASTRPAGRLPRRAEAREAGFDHVNLDLIYGTPGEQPEDFAASLDAAVAAGVDHVVGVLADRGGRAPGSRPGCAAARSRTPDDDVAADRYLAAEDAA